MKEATLKAVSMEMRINEVYINGNIALYKNNQGKIIGRVIKKSN